MKTLYNISVAKTVAVSLGICGVSLLILAGIRWRENAATNRVFQEVDRLEIQQLGPLNAAVNQLRDARADLSDLAYERSVVASAPSTATPGARASDADATNELQAAVTDLQRASTNFQRFGPVPASGSTAALVRELDTDFAASLKADQTELQTLRANDQSGYARARAGMRTAAATLAQGLNAFQAHATTRSRALVSDFNRDTATSSTVFYVLVGAAIAIMIVVYLLLRNAVVRPLVDAGAELRRIEYAGNC